MKVTQITPGRFHHFHLARQLYQRDLLDAIWCGYPRFKLKDETGIPEDKIRTFPWVQTPYLFLNRFPFFNRNWIRNDFAWAAHQLLDRHVAKQLSEATTVVGLSASGLISGTRAKTLGGKYICDRGSSHIKYQNDILKEEYKLLGLDFPGIDKRIIEKEELEYEQADKITVPSEFVRRSFISMGVDESKIVKIPYGARLDRFKKTKDPSTNKFTVLWVGAVTIRKGFFYLLEAFQSLQCSSKELIVVGSLSQEVKTLLNKYITDKVVFKGVVANQELKDIYSSAHVFVLPSIEEGLAMVMGEALACGCPVIASTNSGAEDLFENGKEGFIIPIRSSEVIREKLQQLVDDPNLRNKMSEAAIDRTKSIGGWNKYGASFSELITSL